MDANVPGNALLGHYKTTRTSCPDAGSIIPAGSRWSEDFIIQLQGATTVSSATGGIVCKHGFTSPIPVHAK